ncbi:hypothetical protein LguiA_002357 [Lonicera macranthoides]
MEKIESEFRERQFNGKTKLNKAAIYEALARTVKGKGPQDHEDFACLIILYMVVTLFFPNSLGAIGWSFLPYMEKFKNINKIAWATVIYENLMKSIKKHHDDPIRTPGLLAMRAHKHCTANSTNEGRNAKVSALEHFLSKARNAELDISDLDNVEIYEEIQNISEAEKRFFQAKTEDGADDGADNKKSKSLDISKEEKERIFNEEIERLNKENNLVRQRIVELEKILEVKQNGKLKHLKPRSEELQCETKVVDSSSPLEEKDGLEDYVEFECMTLNDDISFKTPEKHEEEKEKEEKPKEQIVKSFVLRLKTRKRKQKDDDMFVYYLRDNQRKEENEMEDDTTELKIVKKHVQEQKCNKEEQKKTKRGKKNSTKENDAPTFELLVDNTQSTMEAIDADDYEYRTETPKKSQYRSMKTMREIMQYLEPDQQKVVECFFKNTNRHVVAWHDQNSNIHITGSLLEDLMCNLFVDAQSFVKHNNEKNQKRCLDDIILSMPDDIELLLFPMNSARNSKDKKSFHWTLLVLDLKKKKWSHYNSLHPKGIKRKFDNHYIDDAKKMKDAVTYAMNIRLYMRDQPHMEEPMELIVKECPQQGESVDCALYVCDFCEKLIRGETIPKFCNGTLMQAKRAIITWLILTDEPHSWKPECSNQEAVDDVIQFIKKNEHVFTE